MGTAAARIDLVSDDFKRDPFSRCAALREAGPLLCARVPLLGECWLVTSHAAVGAVLKDAQHFAVDARNAGRGRFDAIRLPIPRSLRSLADNMLGRDDPAHRRLRGLVERAFRRQSVGALRERIRALADERLDRLAGELARVGTVDLVAELARPLPLAVICELLGLPASDHPRFARWASGLAGAASAIGMLRAMPSLRRLTRYLRAEFARRRSEPGPGLVSALVEEEEAGERLSEDELLSMVFLLLLAGHETTANLIGGGALALLDPPRERGTAFGGEASAAATAVDELLRFVSPVQLTKPRYAVEPLELGGERIERGDVLLPMLVAANGDPAVFTAPERLDLERRPNPHLAFGTGVHSCLGLQLARAEAEIAFERLFARWPELRLAVPAGALRWTRRLGLRALVSLPVCDGARSRGGRRAA